MAELSSEAIAYLGHLSRIALTEEEKTRFAGQLSSVVGYIEQLSEVDTSNVKDLKGVTGMANVMAADEVRTNSDPLQVAREDLLKGAPAQTDNFIEVRAVLGDSEESA